MNPFILAGLVFGAIGLVQEAIAADEKGKPKLIAGPAGKPGKDGAPGLDGAAGKDGKPGKDAKPSKPLAKPSDG